MVKPSMKKGQDAKGRKEAVPVHQDRREERQEVCVQNGQNCVKNGHEKKETQVLKGGGGDPLLDPPPL